MEKSAGDARHLAVLQAGDAFGESSLLESEFESEPESETFQAIEPCVFLTLKRAKFLCLGRIGPARQTQSVMKSIVNDPQADQKEHER